MPQADTTAIDRIIRQSEQQIVALHQNIHRTFAQRDTNKASQIAWETACTTFHRQYPNWVYPNGGETQWFNDLAAGDAFAIEYALRFIELRPYFFRSGYLYQKLLRRLNHIPLNTAQSQRHQAIQNAFRAYRLQKRNNR